MMKNNGLAVRDSAIDRTQYTLSLLRVSAAHGLLTRQRLYEIRRALWEEFSETAAQYTLRESSSVCKGTAQRIYASLLYQSDACLLQLRDDKKAMRVLLGTSVSKILDVGRHVILRCFEDCRTVYSQACRSRLNVPIPEYAHAMDTAFSEFCAGYSGRFAAEDICTDIDYPLLFDISSKGVFYIKEYYTALCYENEFCSLFERRDLIRLLLKYGELYGCLYTDLYFNICGVVLNHYLVGRLTNKPPATLFLTCRELESLCVQCRYTTQEDLCVLLDKCLSQDDRLAGKEGLIQYLSGHIPRFSHELLCRVQDGTASRFLVCK